MKLIIEAEHNEADTNRDMIHHAVRLAVLLHDAEIVIEENGHYEK